MSIRAPKVNEEIDVKFLMSEDDDGNGVWEWYTGKVTKINGLRLVPPLGNAHA